MDLDFDERLFLEEDDDDEEEDDEEEEEDEEEEDDDEELPPMVFTRFATDFVRAIFQIVLGWFLLFLLQKSAVCIRLL